MIKITPFRKEWITEVPYRNGKIYGIFDSIKQAIIWANSIGKL